ncbi:glycosyltransferase family 2 protein [Pedobacter jejuensis]|uniref:Glycosyltransferase family 2 protein n=1 Tax=Pedobacter jejuensis TaxID=1268550 RepID=A0A3N0C347_9SPHI|nr:glycosyltransferase family 2 protein [Pedobacter jejuensis]RNL56925.1 glycosyltransferase family 2 protein [Pedobacter jejuensis]
MSKKVAIILLNWNTPDYTASCISSIMKYCTADDYDLIIADNGSTDNSLAILKAAFPQHIYIDNRINLGFAGGNNTALKYSIDNGYEFSLLLNNDTETEEDFLTPLLSHLDKNKNVVAVQPAIYYLGNKEQLWNGGSYFNPYFGITYSNNSKARQQLDTPEKVDWLTGCCLLVRNEALKKIGLLNEKFFLYYEDVELSFRLKAECGELYYIPTTKIYHEAGVSGKFKSANPEGTLSPIIHYYLSRNKIWFLRKYANPFFAILIFLINTFYYGAVFCYLIIRGRNKKVMYLYKGIKEGLFTSKSMIWP